MGTMDWLLNNIGKASWGRWMPGAPAANEGGVDVPEVAGTPIYALADGTLTGRGYFYHGGPYFSTQETGAGSNPGYGVVTENVPGVGQVYYQHIDLAAGLPFCQSGNCAGAQVKAGQLLGYSRNAGTAANPAYETEVGINSTWGGVWGTNTNNALWVTDPRQQLIALAQQNSGASTSSGRGPCPWANVPILGGVYCAGWDVGGNLGVPTAGQSGCAPWDINCAVTAAAPTLRSGLLQVGLFLLGMLLIGIGFYLLFSNPINKAVTEVVSGAAPAAPAAQGKVGKVAQVAKLAEVAA